jgi:hypothetical protein
MVLVREIPMIVMLPVFRAILGKRKRRRGRSSFNLVLSVSEVIMSMTFTIHANDVMLLFTLLMTLHSYLTRNYFLLSHFTPLWQIHRFDLQTCSGPGAQSNRSEIFLESWHRRLIGGDQIHIWLSFSVSLLKLSFGVHRYSEHIDFCAPFRPRLQCLVIRTSYTSSI